MKKHLLFILFISFFIISCNSSESSSSKKKNSLIEKFYKAYNENNFEKIADISVKSISEQLKKLVTDNFNTLGKNKSHIQYSKKYIKKSGTKTLVLSYKCKYEKTDATIYEKFFIDTKKNKISSFVYSGDKNFIDNYENYSKEATEVATNYYDHIIDNDFSILNDILDKQTNFGDSITEKYIQVIKNRRASYGKIISYSQIDINTFFNKGKITIIQRFECKTNKDKKVYEELRLIYLDGKFKIYDYYYAPDYKTLISDQ